MKIRKDRLGREAAAAYLARYRRRGKARAPKTRRSDIGPPAVLDVDETYRIYVPAMGIREQQKLTGRIYDHALGSKPNHANRIASDLRRTR